MALYKYHYIELDTKRSPRISLQNVVAGETGNRLWITVTNNGEVVDMSEKENGEFIYRVCLKIDSDLGTRRQDSSMENSGITFIEAATGDHGKINILLSKDSFTAGMNRARLEIFSKRSADNDTLICSAEWTFRAAQNPSGENAGSVYPSLISLENELEQLKTDTTAAKDAANSAASSANDAATLANTKAGLADAAATSANSAAAAATAAAKRNFYNVKHEESTWEVSGGILTYQTFADDTPEELIEIGEDSVFASQVELSSGTIVTVYEYSRYGDNVYMKSAVTDGLYVTASLQLHGWNAQLMFYQHADETPLQLHIASTQESHGSTYVTFADGEAAAIYAGRHTRDMWLEYETSWEVNGMTVTQNIIMRKTRVTEQTDSNNTTVVAFERVGDTTLSTDLKQEIIAAYYLNGTFYAATYSAYDL